ncbi:hypothetical protein ACFX2I_035724 [Malus domestica]
MGTEEREIRRKGTESQRRQRRRKKLAGNVGEGGVEARTKESAATATTTRSQAQHRFDHPAAYLDLISERILAI